MARVPEFYPFAFSDFDYYRANGTNNVVNRIKYLYKEEYRQEPVSLTPIAQDWELALCQGYTWLTQECQVIILRWCRSRASQDIPLQEAGMAHRNHYVAYSWCKWGVLLHMSDRSFTAAFCGSFPTARPVSPTMDMESAVHWFNLGTNAGIVYW